MTETNIGDICRYRGDDIAYVVRGRDRYGRYLCTAKRVDRTRQGSVFTCVQAGEGDLVVAVPRPTFSPGATIMHEGQQCVVERDDGDWVQLNVPASVHRMKGGGGLNIPPSQVEISKADAVLDSL